MTSDSTPRIATYARVSTDEQTTLNQAPDVEQLAQQRGHVVARRRQLCNDDSPCPQGYQCAPGLYCGGPDDSGYPFIRTCQLCTETGIDGGLPD